MYVCIYIFLFICLSINLSVCPDLPAEEGLEKDDSSGEGGPVSGGEEPTRFHQQSSSQAAQEPG